jgi:glc operon protein GlcG
MTEAVKPSLRLTHEGAMTALRAGIDRAREIGVGQNITIVDESGNLLAFVRMDGARFLSIKTSLKKARTAASHRIPTSKVPQELALQFAVATEGDVTGLEGGLPILFGGVCVGAVGVGSGSSAQDTDVARAALAAIGADAIQS